jgi:RNA processing factor Prp31
MVRNSPKYGLIFSKISAKIPHNMDRNSPKYGLIFSKI